LVWPNGSDFDPWMLHEWPNLVDDLIARAKEWDQSLKFLTETQTIAILICNGAVNKVMPRRWIGMKQFKIVVEKHSDGYVAYPLGLKGVVVGEGDTYEEALTDVKSAIAFHIETFGIEVLESESLVLEAFVAEAGIAV